MRAFVFGELYEHLTNILHTYYNMEIEFTKKLNRAISSLLSR